MSAAARDEALIDAFLSKRQITPMPNGPLVEVGFQSADPELAARAANALADAYVELSQGSPAAEHEPDADVAR